MVSYKELGTCEMFAKAIKALRHPGIQLQQHGADAGHHLGLRGFVARHSSRISSGALAKYANQATLRCMAQGAVEYAKELGKNIPICLHLDHGNSFELCKSCIDMGFSSVMIDGSHLPYDENVALTKQVVELRTPVRVTVEGSWACWPASRTRFRPSTTPIPTPPSDRLRIEDRRRLAGHLDRYVARRQQVQARAVHPQRRGILVPPELRFDILAEIEKKLPGFPIVLHGASSVPQEYVKIINTHGGALKDAVGIPEEQLRRAAKSAVCKINIDSDGRLAMTAAIRKIFVDQPAEFDPANTWARPATS